MSGPRVPPLSGQSPGTNTQSAPSVSSMLTLGAWVDFFGMPCVGESFLTGAATAGAMGLHMYRNHPKHVFNGMVGAFVFCSSASFFMCATVYNKRLAEERKWKGPHN